MRNCLLLVCLLAAGCASHDTGNTAAAPSGVLPKVSAASRHKTDRNLDLSINGDGYFIVQTEAGGFLFTRNGELAVSSKGELVNGDGYRLYPPISIPPNSEKLSIAPDGAVRREVREGIVDFIGQLVLSRFDHADRLERDGIYYMPTDASGDPITGRPGTKGLGVVQSGELED